MKFSSSAGKTRNVSAREAILHGLAPDGGLYQPNEFPALAQSFLSALSKLNREEICLEVLRPFFAEEIEDVALRDIVERTFTFPVPLVEVESGVWALELFHGPTFAFKDFGARFLARVTSFFRRGESRELTILVATSGDTGSAVANGFHGVEGIRVVLLYPRGRVSKLQEQQLTTVGGNCTALEVDGSFDDCQRLVKQAFLDCELRSTLDLSSANSINIGRLLPQICYYFFGVAQLPVTARKSLLISVPSGNFGNLSAGLIASRLGLEVKTFVAALNRNDVFARYLQSGTFSPMESLETLSNAMDVGNPSNIERLRAFFSDDLTKIRASISSETFSDGDTVAEMRRVFERTGYFLDPHGAVASLGLKRFLDGRDIQEGIFLATAHPAKFTETVEQAIGATPPMPESLAACLKKTKVSIHLPPRAEALKEFLLS